MDFTFNDEQLSFQDSVRAFLTNQVTPERLRELWASDSGRSDELWAQLADLGLTALNVPEEFGGLGLNETDWVLLAQECGYAALAEPLLDSLLVGAPLLAALDDAQRGLKAEWLERIAAGRARLAVGHPDNLLVADAHVADLLLLGSQDEVHAVPRAAVSLTHSVSLDPGRRLYSVSWTPSAATLVASGEQARALWAGAFERGALACAAQLLGLAKRMVDLAVDYSFERKQFGKPIGSFQAVKHLMANVAVLIEFAKGPLYRAAQSLAEGHAQAALHVSQARLACAEAAMLAAKNAIQVHGAMGYTWEVDLQLYMKRAWALDKVWGDRALHKARLCRALFEQGLATGAGHTFARPAN
ncbi:acyl-CoA dehydrogenase family protein [Pseudomonas panipatensis]|uniref:Acyl-CoA dehydrogenase n=1 Tax=Pseudomonas panipatensis TaxID=428992 RepID=A0A1G8EMA1_9PSED|nr:acyl-CoA dehydrogenase family protein [Pseudomonas panipatensis]SDH70922.1 Acyl-CoA dehydrogenase [Pseudomonas panipatensis]SMP68362.1 Acyl-CoA dehydrogenase [Pseudomonas panipatensis]